MMNASSATPIVPHTTSTKRLPSARPIPSGSGRHGGVPSIRGFGHSTASAANEITSTAAAAHANTTSGSGRFLVELSPLWANSSMWLEGGLQRVLERRQAERALQARGDLAVRVDHEQPRLRRQVERLQRRAQPLVRVVV